MLWRYILAGILSMLVIVAWTSFRPQGRRPVDPALPVPKPAVVAPENAGAAQLPKPGEAAAPARPERERKEKRVDAGRFEYVADSRGGSLAKVFLTESHESVESNEPYQLLFPPREWPATLSLVLELEGKPAISADENWILLDEPDPVGGTRVIFENEADGITVRKTLSLAAPKDGAPPGDSPRHLNVRVELTNRGAAEKRLVYSLHGPAAIDTESLQKEGTDIELAYGAWGRRGGVQADVLSVSELPGGHWERAERIAWVGVSNNYFTGILFPLEALAAGEGGGAGAALPAPHLEKAFGDAIPDPRDTEALARAEHGKPTDQLRPETVSALAAKAYKNLRAGFRTAKLTLKPGETAAHEYGLYLGPRSAEDLARYDALNFRGVNDYGLFGFIVKLFIWLLGILKTVAFGSWGLAIILLTVLVKACLHPVNKKSQAGMMRFQKKMQKIKPEMDELKARYGQNKVKMNQEMQKLWKAHGINPAQQMAGCLMIFLQLPIWYGLYSTLQYAIGLRQAGFIWIEDLTRPDKLFNMGVSLPFLGEWFNLLPILYVILTVVNQRLQPKPQDPQMLAQYRMMSFMLVFFGFIFYSFPAGFMLYIMTSAALGILESKIIKIELAREEQTAAATVPVEAAYPGRPKKAERGSAPAPWRKGKR